MDLSTLKPAAGSTKNKKRVGRGQGSGHGNHTVGKGHKGQKSRSGGSVPTWFEGGQMPLQRRVPKFGFKNRGRVAYDPINLGRLADLVEAGTLSATVTPATLREHGIGGKNGRVKVLGDGTLRTALTVHAHAFSASAKQKIEAAGGTATVVE